MATYKILYWQEIPSQIKAEDDAGNDVDAASSTAKFIERIDRSPPQRGLQGTDDYLAQWKWSDEAGTRRARREEVAEAVKARTRSRRPADLVRLRSTMPVTLTINGQRSHASAGCRSSTAPTRLGVQRADVLPQARASARSASSK